MVASDAVAAVASWPQTSPPAGAAQRRRAAGLPVPLSRVFLLLFPIVASGCPAGLSVPAGQPANAPPWFREVTEEVGLHFVHDAGPFGRYFLPQVIGSGAALFDYDNDGRLDVYLL